MPIESVDGWELAYEEAGSGPVVFLLHGLLFDRSQFDHQAAALSSGYRVIRVDAPGHGESPARAVGYSFEDEVEALVGLGDALGAGGPVVWGGLSMGGMKAMRMALAHPDRVRALVLMECQPYPENPDLKAQYDALFDVLKESGPNEDIVAIALQVMFGSAAQGSALAEEWKQRWLKMDAAAAEACWRSVMDRGDIGERLSEITAPALVIHGTDDVAISIDIAREYAPKIRGAELVEIEGAGHSSSMEEPEKVTAAVRSFLAKLS